MSYQKKDGSGHARPSFFWYDNNKGFKALIGEFTVIVMEWPFPHIPHLFYSSFKEFKRQIAKNMDPLI